jgi:GAF domain-containing protein
MHLSAEIDTAQTIRHRRMFHLADIENNPNATADDVENARLAGYRTRLMVPMVRGDRTLGLIAVTREDPTPFPDQLVELLRTFADQAVIAIENARLFEAEQASKRELTEALEQQTATADVLKAISRSAFDVQKVLDTLIEAAVKLTGAKTGILRCREGDVYPLVASFGLKPEWHELIGQLANAPGRDTLVGRVTLEGRTVQIPDVFADPDFSNVEAARIIGFRANIGTPLHRDGQMIGYMAFQKETAGPFGTRQVELIETFANQAVIAIENTRLFEAEQARTKELRAVR